MIEVEPSISFGCQPDVHDVIGPGYEADESRYEEHDSLRRVLRIRDGEGAHHKEARADDQERKGGQHCAPVLTHLGMPPAVCVGLLRGQVAVLLDERVAVPGRCVLGILVVALGVLNPDGDVFGGATLLASHGRGYHGGAIDAYRLVGLLLEGVVNGEAPGPVVVHIFWLGFSAFFFPCFRCPLFNNKRVRWRFGFGLPTLAASTAEIGGDAAPT